MRIIKNIVLSLIPLFFYQGCLLRYSWEDYLPLVAVEIGTAPHCISTKCRPKHKGKHLLSLQIEKVHKSPISVNLEIKGRLVIEYGDGTSKILMFNERFNDEYWLPPTPADFNILQFDIEELVKVEECQIYFEAEVLGEVSELLKREPNCRLIIRFNDGKK